MKERVFAGLVMRDNHGRYLTLNHCNRKHKPWSFAGGKIKPGELPIIAAARELREELGVVANSLSFVATTFSNDDDGNEWIGLWFALGSYYGTMAIQEPTKHSEMLWLSPDELVQYGVTPEAIVAQRQESLR